MQKCFTSTSSSKLHPSLLSHLSSPLATSARFNPIFECYEFENTSKRATRCGGLHKTLTALFYSHYVSDRSKRKSDTYVTGSNKEQGIEVDRQIGQSVAGKLVNAHPMTRRLLQFWKDSEETLQASQVPVQLTTEEVKMTQADLITMDKRGRLILYEIKTGMPVGLNRTQDYFTVEQVHNVPCTKKNIWFLQLAYTQKALEQARVEIYKARVIQIYEDKRDGLVVKVHPLPKWAQESLPDKPVYCAVPFKWPVAKKKRSRRDFFSVTKVGKRVKKVRRTRVYGNTPVYRSSAKNEVKPLYDQAFIPKEWNK